MRSAELTTGDVEVHATSLQVVGPAETPAIQVARAKGEELAAEELRLKYRHLDLRRPELQANLILRHRLLQRARRALSELDFLELETPILTKPTPEGARDYLVPSRVHPGEFYALPQSPQIYKQLLMVSGFDRYFQIARCFRDEDLRFDRQPEFSQIDIEASFVGQEDVIGFVETVLVALWDETGNTIARPFPRLTWRESMERYGTDKPDLRFDFPITDWTAQVQPLGVPFFQGATNGSRVRGIAVRGGGTLSRKDVDQLTETAKTNGAPGLAWVKRQGEQLSGSVGKHFTAEALGRIGLGDGDVALMTVGPDRVTSPALDKVRQEVIRRLAPQPKLAHAFCWVVDFPLFEPDPETGKPVFAHHPFTSPHPDDLGKLDSDPFACRALHYDAVYNGNELGSGSIRITDPAIQRRIFAHLGLSPTDIDARFGFLLTALAAGAPPHGGVAGGVDRTAMLLAGAGPVAQALIDLARMGENLDVHDVERLVSDEAHGELGRQGAAPDPVKIILPGLRRVIQPKTAGQREYLRSIAEHDIVIGIGPAGTGKTYLAVAAAVDALARKRVRRIILARPAVEAGGKPGLLPRGLEGEGGPLPAP